MTSKGGKAVVKTASETRAKKQKDVIDITSRNTILCVTFGAIAIVAVVLLIYYVGIADGIASKLREISGGDIEIAPILSEATSITYEVSAEELDESISTSLMMSEYDTNEQNYRIIRNKEQLGYLIDSVNARNGDARSYVFLNDIDDDYFDSSSVIAVALEGANMNSLGSIINIYRDESYDVHLDIDDSQTCEMDCSNAVLVLIRIPNIKPRNIYVNYSSYIDSLDY